MRVGRAPTGRQVGTPQRHKAKGAEQSDGSFIAHRQGRDLHVIEHLFAGAAIVPSQTPAASQWSPERRLAAAVLAAALAEVRNHHAQASYRRAINGDLEWIFSDDTQWPFSFVPLCHALAVEPDYVRTTVRRWLSDWVMSARPALLKAESDRTKRG